LAGHLDRPFFCFCGSDTAVPMAAPAAGFRLLCRYARLRFAPGGATFWAGFIRIRRSNAVEKANEFGLSWPVLKTSTGSSDLPGASNQNQAGDRTIRPGNGWERDRSELPVVCESDEGLERDNLDEGCVDQAVGELAGREVVAELPAVSSENEESTDCVTCGDRIGQAHDLERNLLLRGASGLLPLERNEDPLVVAGRDGVDPVDAPAAAFPNDRLLLCGVSASREGGQDHRL
jgi:hypothetical protein